MLVVCCTVSFEFFCTALFSFTLRFSHLLCYALFHFMLPYPILYHPVLTSALICFLLSGSTLLYSVLFCSSLNCFLPTALLCFSLLLWFSIFFVILLCSHLYYSILLCFVFHLSVVFSSALFHSVLICIFIFCRVLFRSCLQYFLLLCLTLFFVPHVCLLHRFALVFGSTIIDLFSTMFSCDPLHCILWDIVFSFFSLICFLIFVLLYIVLLCTIFYNVLSCSFLLYFQSICSVCCVVLVCFR